MNVLGIESSCDETAAAVVRDDGVVLSDVVASQFDVHTPYGGVVPELASRAHLSNVVPVIEQAVRVLPRGFADVDAIAVTNGPGLVGALLVGLMANYTDFLFPKAAMFSNIALMVMVLLWRPQGLYPVANR